MRAFLAWVLMVMLALSPASFAETQDLAPKPLLYLSSFEPVQGGIVYGTAREGAQVWLDARRVPVSEDGRFFLAFHYNAAGTAGLKVRSKDGREDVYDLTIKPRDFRIERIDGLPQNKVTAPPERQKRIAAEAAIKRKARTQRGMHQNWREAFIDPVETYRISGFYGSQRILNGVPKRPHYGIDLAAPRGTPVKAPAGGVVTLAEADFWYEGGLIFLDHGHGMQSAFLHLNEVSVKVYQHFDHG
ncbi:MAG: M23 family metallopeptidase [Pseudomonadota bacterium]